MSDYDDDRPGMMRLHVAQERAEELCRAYTYRELQQMAAGTGIRANQRKSDLAVDIVLNLSAAS